MTKPDMIRQMQAVVISSQKYNFINYIFGVSYNTTGSFVWDPNG
jgi:hypothetical protein